jgi:predicted permease
MPGIPSGGPRPPLSLRFCLTLIRVAGALVPRDKQHAWKAQWQGELLHRWQHRQALEQGAHPSPQSFILWSVGAFQHAWYLLRTEYTMDLILQDLKYGIRSMRRSRGLILIAILSLGIGIGANTSMFSAVDVFMLRPLPHPESEDLNMLWIANPEQGFDQASFTVPDFLDLQAESNTMELAGVRGASYNLSGEFDAERLMGFAVTPEFFQVLGDQPAQGRGFLPEEGIQGNDQVAVISHGLWQRRYGADPDLVGSTILLDGEAHTLVGIMPEHFWFRYPGQDVWTPLAFSGEESRNDYYLGVLGRVSDGSTRSQAYDELQGLMARISREFPETSAGHQVRMETLHAVLFDDGFKAGSLISMVAVALVLLIACANVANLLLTHAAGREREVAVRGALGAGRSRIIRQFLTEATIIALVGGVLGVGLAVLGIKGLISIMPPNFPRVHEIGLSPRVLLYTAGITMLTGIIFGLAPALHSTGGKLTDALKEGGRGGSGARGGRLRKGLVVAEVALALVLLVSSALLVQGFVNIRLADLGFDRSDVLTLQTLLPERQYPDSTTVNEFWAQLHAELSSIPGVVAVGGTSLLPLQGNNSTWYALAGEDLEDRNQRKISSYRSIRPGYFEALDVPILRGRDLQDGDREGTVAVAVISQAMAERHWPDEDPLGQQILFYSGPKEIVGVVADTRNTTDASGDQAMIYLSAAQSTQRFMDWAIEASVPLGSLVEPVRSAVRSLDPTIPAYSVMSLDDLIDLQLGGDTIMAKIMAALALVALVLALGGVYGVMAYTVSQRTRELGIRMSLGAQQGSLMTMVVRQGTVLALLGIVIGTGVALGVTRGLSRFLFGVSPFDPLTFASVALVLFLAGVSATLFPARRATRVDPVEALRVE